jgi:lipoprotein NlpI
MKHLLVTCLAAIGLIGAASFASRADDATTAWSAEEQAKLQVEQSQRVKQQTIAIEKTPASIDAHSKRGDAYFFLGEFDKSLADYEKMVQLDESMAAGHWRRGIADFYAGKFKAAADQFELYHSFDDVDRENGIWRYLSQFKAHGRDKAREGLLKYKKDDREPFPAVYQLFAGKLTPYEILKQIRKAEIDDDERQKRMFYAELYIGLNYDVEKEPQKALEHLRAATAIIWPRKAGYGPNYMWHVGRVHMLELEQRLKDAK